MPFPARVLPLVLAFAVPAAAAAAEPGRDAAAEQAFVESVAAEHGADAATVRAALAEAAYRQSIIDAITRPAEAKPWHAYRPIFMNERRIREGRAFLAEHREALAKVERDTGVPAELVVAIIGVETSYGRITGSYRVLDALYTLGFHYPPRQDFFRRELGHLFALATEEGLDIPELKGSYAGAMGWGQFMPSSYRAYAVDGDGDGRRDLWNSTADIFASIANYFVAHGWNRGAPVALPAQVAADATDTGRNSLEAKYSLPELADMGYAPIEAVDPAERGNVIALEGADGPEHWIGFRNFYVISRYNRSALYSLAVLQLAEAVAGRDAGGVAP